jgi:hypothetical protein
MNTPSILLGIILSTLYGSGFHLWRGGNLGRLILYLILGWAGFWIGQALANSLGWNFLSFGPLHLGMATLLSFIFLGLGYWLGKIERSGREQSHPRQKY